MQYHANRNTRRALAGSLLLGGALALAACGDGGSSSDDGSLTLGITDAEVDTAQEVNVIFTGITLKPQDGEPVTFQCDEPAGDPDFDCDGDGYRKIDLLTLTGDESETLLDAVELDAGRYDWIRLHVNAKAPGSPTLPDVTIPGTTIVPEGGGHEDLLIPSGPQTGLKLVRGFVVPSGGAASFTIDFDLRKAVTHSGVGYMLRPAFRLVDNGTSGHLVGEITSNFVITECASGNADGGLAVYVYEGNNATTGEMGDPDNAPLITDRAKLDVVNGNYDYRIGFLEAGEYTAAVTCEAESDTEADEALLDFFVETVNVSVSAGLVPTVLDFD